LTNSYKIPEAGELSLPMPFARCTPHGAISLDEIGEVAQQVRLDRRTVKKHVGSGRAQFA